MKSKIMSKNISRINREVEVSQNEDSEMVTAITGMILKGLYFPTSMIFILDMSAF